jgi:DNA-binding CsgD family transcriptional regulator
MAWDGFGEDAFRFLIVERIPDLSLLRDREQWWLDEGETHKPGVGYNLSSQSRMKGFRFTPEQCARLSASLKGKPKSPEYVAAMKLRPVTEGQIASGRALGLRGKGVPKTKAHNRKNGLAQRGSKNHAAKLTEADVIEIHWLLAIGEKSNAKIGRIYGIAATTVHSIRHGKSWPHLKPKY